MLDAGCGRISALLVPRRIDRIVGVDIHEPREPLPHLDEFAIVDLCGPGDAFRRRHVRCRLSNFTLEHFAEPAAALANLRRWLRPGGTLVATTVNRRHPFVAAYLGCPAAPPRIQPLVKASTADAHPLVGRCNDPATVRRPSTRPVSTTSGSQTVGHLARAWGRHLPDLRLGLAGDLTSHLPSRRSTIVAVANAASDG